MLVPRMHGVGDPRACVLVGPTAYGDLPFI